MKIILPIPRQVEARDSALTSVSMSVYYVCVRAASPHAGWGRGGGCWRGGPGKYVVTIDSFRNTQEAGTLHSSVEPGSSAVQCSAHGTTPQLPSCI